MTLIDVATGFGCLGVLFLVAWVVWQWIQGDDPATYKDDEVWQRYYDEYLKNEPDQSLNWDKNHKEGL